MLHQSNDNYSRRGEHNENDLLQCDSQSGNGTVFTVYFCFCFTEMR